jgi:HD superfamily phosphohydrolase
VIQQIDHKHLIIYLCRGVRDDKMFLFDIVANQRNSIDVDKFDYIARDSHYLGVPPACDTSR